MPTVVERVVARLHDVRVGTADEPHEHCMQYLGVLGGKTQPVRRLQQRPPGLGEETVLREPRPDERRRRVGKGGLHLRMAFAQHGAEVADRRDGRLLHRGVGTRVGEPSVLHETAVVQPYQRPSLASSWVILPASISALRISGGMCAEPKVPSSLMRA